MGTPTLKFFHANGKGTGGAMSIGMVPATDTADGFYLVKIAKQKMIPPRGNTPDAFDIFDFDSGIAFPLSFVNACEVMRVFRGEVESLCDGRGIFVKWNGYTIQLTVRHVIEPVLCYIVEVFRNSEEDKDGDRARIMLFNAEALGLLTVLEHSMATIVFGGAPC